MAKKPPHRPSRFTKKKLLEAIEGSGGYITVIAKRLGCSVRHVHRLVEKYGDAADELIEAERCAQLDFAEGKLQRAIRNDNMTAIIFYLKTQGRHRGYVERAERVISSDETIGIEILPAEERED